MTAQNDGARTWGPAATLGWMVFILIASSTAEYMAFRFVFYETFVGTPTDDLDAATASLIVSFAVTTVLTLTAVKLRRGASAQDYLALRACPVRTAWGWLVVATVVATLVAWVRLPEETAADARLLDQRALVPYVIVLVLLTPLSEELLFRGFTISGFCGSRFFSAAAVPVSGALWATAHSEESWVDYVALFVLGCVLGAMRVKSHSILPPLLAHMVSNLGAFLFVAARGSF
jgi:membrane protease YdiL (CAAX protease family)